MKGNNKTVSAFLALLGIMAVEVPLASSCQEAYLTNAQKSHESNFEGWHRNRSAENRHAILKTIEITALVENSMNSRLMSQHIRSEKYVLDIMNVANEVLSRVGISVAVTNMEVWDQGNRISVGSDHTVLLENVAQYRLKMEASQRGDHTIFFSGVRFAHQTVGYAKVKAMCTDDNSASVVQVVGEGRGAAHIGHTVAHELGHSIGFPHDDEDLSLYCACSAPQCVMTRHVSCIPLERSAELRFRNVICQSSVRATRRRVHLTLLSTTAIPVTTQRDICSFPFCDSMEWTTTLLDPAYHFQKFDHSCAGVRTFVNWKYEGMETLMNGIPCEEGKVCVNNTCISVVSTFVHCVANCSGNGICNTLGHCHCLPGYAPPFCNFSGYGGSVVSGHPYNPHEVLDFPLLLFILFLVAFALVTLLCCLWRLCQMYWSKTLREKSHTRSPVLTKCVDKTCCSAMTFCTRWIYDLGPCGDVTNKEEVRVDEKEQNALNPRNTLCQVDVEFKCPETDLRTWGVASENLIIDKVTITPTHSPDLRRKIHLNSSPKNVKKPKFHHSISKDSGCVSDEDNRDRNKSFAVSMGSLINVFKDYGPSRSQENENKVSVSVRPSQQLRKLVIDPLSTQRLSKQGSPAPPRRPLFQRSLTVEGTTSHNANSPPVLPKMLNKSEELLYRVNGENESQIMIQSPLPVDPGKTSSLPRQPPLSVPLIRKPIATFGQIKANPLPDAQVNSAVMPVQHNLSPQTSSKPYCGDSNPKVKALIKRLEKKYSS